MKTFEIWMEGFTITGNDATASLLGTETAKDWDDAVNKHIAKHPETIDVRELNGRKTYTNWGCRLFDNEADARKAFG